MTRFICATYHASIKVAEFITDDGRHLLRLGGTLPWRINNCGDLSSPVNSRGEPSPKKTKNHIGFAKVPSKTTGDAYHFFIFPDYATGREQLELSLKRRYSSSTIPQLVNKYAPSGDNDSAKYCRDLLRETGIDDDKLVSQLSTQELQRLADAIEKIEGYHSDAASRKEVWVPVSRITATDGARPLADEEIILRIDGKDIVIKSDGAGQFPPVPHKNAPVQILRKHADGGLRLLGTLDGDAGRHFSLSRWFQSFSGMSGPDVPPGAASARQAPLAYVVQPGDTLSGIAQRFKISTVQLKRDNNLARDLILPGQRLSIHGAEIAPDKAPKPPARVTTSTATTTPTSRAAPKAAVPARSRKGAGQPLALLAPDQRRAPWMAVAFREAREFAGKKEDEITKTRNYHRLVTDSDRAGGRTVALKDAKGRPRKDAAGNVLTKTTFNGSSSLVSQPWCASFVNYCLREAGYAAGRRPASSFSYAEDKDRFALLKEPIYGALRFSLRDEGGHICFVYGTAGEKLVILGGNQSDRLCFQIRSRGDPGEAFFVPIPYKDFAATEAGLVLPEIDIEALRKEFGEAVLIRDNDILSTRRIKNKEN